MQKDTDKTQLFYEYYRQWVDVYKKGAIREATMAKYRMTQKWVEKLAPNLKVSELNRTAYQKLLNDYAEEHERQTTLDSHHQLKGAILDALDEGLIERDPTRKAIIKGKSPRAKRIKYLSQFELHTLIAHLDLTEDVNWDWFIIGDLGIWFRLGGTLFLDPFVIWKHKGPPPYLFLLPLFSPSPNFYTASVPNCRIYGRMMR